MIIFVQALIITTQIGSRYVNIGTQFMIRPQDQCHPADMFLEDSKTNSRIFKIHNDQQPMDISFVPQSLNNDAVVLLNQKQLIDTKYTIDTNQTLEFVIEYSCQIDSWGYIELHVYEQQLHIYRYVKLCRPLIFNDYPKAILLVIIFIFIVIGGRYGYEYQNHERDELSSRSTFYRIRHAKRSVSQYNTADDSVDDVRYVNQDASLKIKLISYLTFITTIIAWILYQYGNLQDLPLIVTATVTLHITIRDLIAFIVLSDYSPEIKLPVFQFARVSDIIILLISFAISISYIFNSSWIYENIFKLCVVLQLSRIYQFRSLKSIVILNLLSILLLLAKLNYYSININWLAIQFPNTYFLNLPQPTCISLSVSLIYLPIKTLQFLNKFCNQSRNIVLIWVYILSLIVSLVAIYMTNLPDVGYDMIINFIPLLNILIAGLRTRLWHGILGDVIHDPIKEEQNFELTLDRNRIQ